MNVQPNVGAVANSAPGVTAQPLSVPEPLGPDGRFVFERFLGEGGFGEVWRAHDLRFHRPVAIKLLRADLVRNPDWRARRSDAMAARLRSPHVAQIYDLLEDADRCALIMEFVPGLTLSQRLRATGPLSVTATLRVANAVAEALDAAHRARIVHRDIKPANIMLGESKEIVEDDIKVVDWGLALGVPQWTEHSSECATSDHEALAAGPFRFAGTAEYMAPEQIEGKVDRRADIWAYGCVLYECLTGQRAFSGRGPELIRKICCAEVDLPAIPAEAPEPLRLLVEMCLEPDPNKRLRDIADAFSLLKLTPRRMPEQSARRVIDLVPAQQPNTVARATLVAEVAELVERMPLVALSGAVGCGKSWVALSVAHNALVRSRAGTGRFGAGVAFIELRDVVDASTIPSRIVAALFERDARASDGAPTTSDLESLWQKVAGRAAGGLLVILDDADGVLRELPKLLSNVRIPGLHLLVTARRSPGHTGWTVHAVDPLDCPPEYGTHSAPSLQAYDAVRLFVERAVASWKLFRLDASNAHAVAEICRRLGGLPRAIELVASRVRFMTPEEILVRLTQIIQPLVRKDLARDSQTVSRTVEWSVESASPDERLLLERLSLFEGSWTSASVEAVCCDERLPPTALHDLLNGLIDQALVQPDSSSVRPRYRLFEVVRDLCRRRLDVGERAEELGSLRRRHLARFAELVAEPPQASDLPPQRLPRGLESVNLNHDQADCCAAIRRALTDPLALATAVDMAIEMQDYWYDRGRYAEGIDLLTPLLAAWGERGDVRQVRLLAARAKLVWLRDPRTACDGYRRALQLQRQIVAQAPESTMATERTRLAAVLHNVGLASQQMYDFESSRAALAEARGIYAELKSEVGEANTRLTLAILDASEDRLDDAETNLSAAIPVLRRTEDVVRVSTAIQWRARIALIRGDCALAWSFCREALAMRMRTDEPEGVAESLGFAGQIACAGEPIGERIRSAILLFGAASRRRGALGVDVQATEVASYESALGVARNVASADEFDVAWAEGCALSDQEALDVAVRALGGHRATTSRP
ncbi:MAG: protein kinase [Phycisphaerae bacterium]|nr:protein kinase [Phycisphaerae bacterium]